MLLITMILGGFLGGLLAKTMIRMEKTDDQFR